MTATQNLIDTYLARTGGRYETMVWLADLGADKATVIEMVEAGIAAALPCDASWWVTPERAAAGVVISGSLRTRFFLLTPAAPRAAETVEAPTAPAARPQVSGWFAGPETASQAAPKPAAGWFA